MGLTKGERTERMQVVAQHASDPDNYIILNYILVFSCNVEKGEFLVARKQFLNALVRRMKKQHGLKKYSGHFSDLMRQVGEVKKITEMLAKWSQWCQK